MVPGAVVGNDCHWLLFLVSCEAKIAISNWIFHGILCKVERKGLSTSIQHLCNMFLHCFILVLCLSGHNEKGANQNNQVKRPV